MFQYEFSYTKFNGDIKKLFIETEQTLGDKGIQEELGKIFKKFDDVKFAMFIKMKKIY